MLFVPPSEVSNYAVYMFATMIWAGAFGGGGGGMDEKKVLPCKLGISLFWKCPVGITLDLFFFVDFLVDFVELFFKIGE